MNSEYSNSEPIKLSKSSYTILCDIIKYKIHFINFFTKVSVTQLQQMNDHKKFVKKLQQLEMEKNILIDKIKALTKKNTELKKLQGEAVKASRDKRDVKRESAQKIMKATTRNQQEHRA